LLAIQDITPHVWLFKHNRTARNGETTALRHPSRVNKCALRVVWLAIALCLSGMCTESDLVRFNVGGEDCSLTNATAQRQNAQDSAEHAWCAKKSNDGSLSPPPACRPAYLYQRSSLVAIGRETKSFTE
jgi:hypothetical protein